MGRLGSVREKLSRFVSNRRGSEEKLPVIDIGAKHLNVQRVEDAIYFLIAQMEKSNTRLLPQPVNRAGQGGQTLQVVNFDRRTARLKFLDMYKHLELLYQSSSDSARITVDAGIKLGYAGSRWEYDHPVVSFRFEFDDGLLFMVYFHWQQNRTWDTIYEQFQLDTDAKGTELHHSELLAVLRNLSHPLQQVLPVPDYDFVDHKQLTA